MVATRARTALAVALAALITVVPPALAGHVTIGSTASPTFSPATSTVGCTGPIGASAVTGALSMDGGPASLQQLGGVSLSVGYFLAWELVDTFDGVVVGSGCQGTSTPVETGPSGAFSAPLPLPGPVCRVVSNVEECTEYSAVLGPLSLSDPSPPPAGYAFSAQAIGNGDAFAAEFVWELSSVQVAPAGPTVTVSPGAPTELTATAYMANGSATPLLPTFRWSVSGGGWSVASSGGPTAVFEASDGAGPASAVVTATALSGTVEESASLAIGLVEIPTAIVLAGYDRTELDVGVPSTVTVEATGAAGYSYQALVLPGLGEGSLPAPCTAVSENGSTVGLTCTANVSYTSAGTAQPVVQVSNGYSTATWSLPPVTVAPDPVVSWTPVAPAGYAGVPVALTVGVANGSGLSPFAPFCLDPGNGPSVCAADPASSWTFEPVYANPGTYAAVAWTSDQSGANASARFSVRVFPSPTLGPLSVSGPNVTVGEPVTVSSTLSGGDLPARLYWNVSGSASPWSTASAVADGSWSATLLPETAGPCVVSLTAVDALGTVTRTSTVVTVGPVPAVRLVGSTVEPSGSVVVGSGVGLSFAAVDPYGNPVRSFASPAVLTVSGSAVDARGWVNASAAGTLPRSSNGSYAVPPSAWIDGVLDVSIVPTSVGPFSVSLAAASIGPATPVGPFSAVADLSHVRLFAPRVAIDGPRSNATFWQVTDRFGNPAPGALLSVRTVVGSTSTASLVIAIALPNGTSGVWVNCTAAGGAAGTFEVVDRAGATVLGPWAIPASPARSTLGPWVWFAVFGAAATLVGLGACATVGRRRPAGGEDSGEEAELLRFAEGRAQVVELLRRLGPSDVPALEAAWEPPPAPREVAEWVASLVADGTLGAAVGSDRRARFLLTERAGRPRIEVDRTAFEEGLRRRDEVGVAD